MEKAVIKDKDDYENELKKQQKDLSEVQQAYYHQGRRAIVVFQGWDASGKGGAIRRITEKLDPRGYQVYPISAPTPEEQGKHYLYRFQNKLPAKGTIAIFDRSWYGRVMVERIEGYAKDTEWQRAYQEINEFERMLTDDGVRIIKMFLHITPEEQLKRFSERLHNPQKQWKLTLDDIRNRDKWPEYENAINDMFRYTSTETSPWHTVAANHKWYARVETLKIINKAMREGVDVTPPPLDDALIKAAEEQLGIVYKG
ncbi:MAG: polyphosphate kinase [Oleibacter sp.]|nr:polyphosphate kinase [Thalassolituus sp.]